MVSPLIMVVDDEVLIRLVAGDILRDAGFQVVEACNADEAMTLLATGVPYNLVFSDVNMPGAVDGIGLTAYVKMHHPTIPVVLTSGGMVAHELDGAGAAAVVSKPYSQAVLTTTITRVLEQANG